MEEPEGEGVFELSREGGWPCSSLRHVNRKSYFECAESARRCQGGRVGIVGQLVLHGAQTAFRVVNVFVRRILSHIARRVPPR